jgi:hypothetical protein
MNPPIIERLRDVHRIDYATRIEAANIITDLMEASETVAGVVMPKAVSVVLKGGR